MNIKRFIKVVLCSYIVVSNLNSDIWAQEIRIIEPLSTFKSIESDDPLRYYHGADPGIPGGDINGDGIIEYIVHNPFYPDKSTPELGDWTENTLIYNMDENGATTYYSIRTGLLFEPAGDLNGDGRDELATVKDSTLYIYTFGAGDFDISGDLTLLYETEITVPLNQFVPGFDFDDDDHTDLLIGTYDYTSGSSLHILFGGDSSDSFEFKAVDTSIDLGSVEIQTNAGDIVGNESSDVILLATTPWPHELMAAAYEVDSLRNISFAGTSDFGSSNVGASTLRFFVENVDGEHKDDLLYSEDRYTSGSGFSQVFFNEPTPYIFLSIVDTSAAKVGTTFVEKMPNWAKKQGAYGLGIDHTIRGDIGIGNNISIAFWQRGHLSVIFGEDISIENPLPEPIPLETENEKDYVFQTQFSRRNRIGLGTDQSVFGIGNPNNWTAGRLRVISTKLFGIQYTFTTTSFSSFHSEIRETKAIPPSKTDDLIGLGLHGEWFPTQYLSLFGQVGLRLDFIGADEISSPTESEPRGSFEANGNLGINLDSGADLLGAFGFTVWFSKAVNADTASLVHSFRVTDFVDFGENDNPSVRMNNIGDINNDGFDDLLMSSGFSSINNVPINKAWLFYGGESYSTMPDYTFDFSQDSATANTFGAFITHKMEPLGDVSGDGIDDFAIQAKGYGSTGAVYVYFGDEDFYDTNAENTEFKYPDLILTPKTVAGQTIFGFGKDVASGDFDGDGKLEIAVTQETGYGDPAPATIQLYKNDGDEIPDIFLTATRSSLGKEGDEIVSVTFSSSIIFLPEEAGKNHQDLLFTPGGFSGYPDAIIFEGGAEADSLPDISLHNPNRVNGFGSISGAKPGVADLNDDGFYDILMLSQADYEDGFVSSRVYSYSPNANIIIDSNEDEESNPFGYRLSQNYPNPFNPTTNIEFKLPKATNVSLKVYDLLGREVALLIDNERYSSGSQTINFNASALASGMYIYKLEAGSFTQTRKMLLIK